MTDIPNKADAPVSSEGSQKNLPESNPSDTTIENPPEVTSSNASHGATDPQIIEYLKENDPKVKELKKKFEGLISNLDFLLDDPWIDSVIKGFKKRDIDKRLEKQLEKTARKKLMDEAFEKVKPGETIKTPTSEEIDEKVNEALDKRSKDIRQAKETKLRKAKTAIIAGK